MKKSISYLPSYAQDTLKKIKQRVLQVVPQCEMIILFGSYARGNFVPYDEREEFGIRTSFMSDYDILLVTSHIDLRLVSSRLDEVEKEYSKRDNDVPIQFITEDITKFQEDIRMGRYFFTEIKSYGVLLYDSRKYELPRRKKLNFGEILKDAEFYFEEKSKRADMFHYLAMCALEKKDYKMASFQLHQAAENYLYAIRLTFTLKNSKQHNLQKLWRECRGHADDLKGWFNLRDKEEKRLFELLKAAYVEGRYNPNFLVTHRDINFINPKIETLKEITYRVCTERLDWYRQQSKLETASGNNDQS